MAVKIILLTQDKEANCSDEDFERLSRYKWHVKQVVHKSRTAWYAVRWSCSLKGKRQKLYMHREILGAVEGREVDHKNGNTLDNQRQNLRPATSSQNKQNSIKQADCSSRFKGVCWHRGKAKWVAYAKRKHLGVFDSEEAAAQAYAEEAKRVFGEFAKCSFNQ